MADDGQEQSRAGLEKIAAELRRLEHEARAAGLHMLAALLERARREAELRLAEIGDRPPPSTRN